MKKLSIIVILSIIFSLCIMPYGCVNAEPDETEDTTVGETSPTPTETSNEETSGNSDNTPATENQSEGNSQEENNNNSENDDSGDEESSSENKPTTNKSNSNNSPAKKPTSLEIKKSDNTNLANLGITPKDYDFSGFKPATLNYSVTVPNDVEKVGVYAKAQDVKAKVTSGIGIHTLEVGSNDLQVVVTAENGDTKTYTITVTREEVKEEKEDTKPEETVTTGNENSNSDLKKLEIKGYSITPAFSADVYEYKLSVKNDVENLDVITEGLNENVSIEVAGNTDLKERRKYCYYFS